MKGKFIGFIGDSVTKDLAQLTVEKYGWQLNETMVPSHAIGTNYRYFDTIFDPPSDTDNTRFSMMWNAGPKGKDNGFGLSSYDIDEYFAVRTKNYFAHTCTKCRNDDPNFSFANPNDIIKPDILVVNSGLHDLYNLLHALEFSFEIYEKQLRDFLKLVQPLAHKIIYKSTNPKTLQVSINF